MENSRRSFRRSSGDKNVRHHNNNLAASFKWPMRLISLVLVIGLLHWAQEILIPIALAILLTFILAPIVMALQRRGLGRTLSVALTVALTFALLGGIGTIIVVEFRSLANELPAYRQNIRDKISDIKFVSQSTAIERLQQTVKDVMLELNKEDESTSSTNATPRSVPVVITGNQPAQPLNLPFITALLEPLGSLALVIVLVVFMLLRREDLRDRLLRLMGYDRLTVTTKAIDETGRHVSKYLLRQFMLNAGFGAGITGGLFLIGLPYAVLCGFIAGVARFIPYVGPWIGAIPPIFLSLAVFDHWTGPLLVIALVSVLEFINNMLVEPVLYGHSIGVSEVALLVMMAFWTWLWGPIGLALAAPLTVCLMVICKNVPALGGLNILLGCHPPLEPRHVFYQRLVAKDKEEARGLVTTFLKDHSRVELFEELMIPALVTSRADHTRNLIDDEDQKYIYQAIRELLGSTRPETISESELSDPQAFFSMPTNRPLILGYPGHDEAEELVLWMLAELFPQTHWRFAVLSPEILFSERIALVESARPVLLCLGVLPGKPLAAVRQIAKKLRAQFPELPLVIGCWHFSQPEHVKPQLAETTAMIDWNLTDTKNQIAHVADASVRAAEDETNLFTRPSEPHLP